MSDTLLKVTGLKKALRTNLSVTTRPVLNGVDFSIGRGEIFGFLGKNGAGKTTTIKTILGLLSKDAGEILLDSKPFNLPNDLRYVGYLPELPYFYDHLSVIETLNLFSSLVRNDSNHSESSKKLLELVGLKDRANSRVKTLSKGLQQRLGLAQAIIGRPKLLFLDEPFSGLDPTGRAEFREIFLNLNQHGTTIMISSHILSDVQSLCHGVSILSGGVVKNSFSLIERAKLFGEQMSLTVQSSNPVEPALGASSQSNRKTPYGHEWKYHFDSQKVASDALKKALLLEEQGGLKVLTYQSEPRSLEDIFLEVTKD